MFEGLKDQLTGIAVGAAINEATKKGGGLLGDVAGGIGDMFSGDGVSFQELKEDKEKAGEVQQMLKDSGYSITVDGDFGGGSIRVAQQFAKDQKLDMREMMDKNGNMAGLSDAFMDRLEEVSTRANKEKTRGKEGNTTQRDCSKSTGNIAKDFGNLLGKIKGDGVDCTEADPGNIPNGSGGGRRR